MQIETRGPFRFVCRRIAAIACGMGMLLGAATAQAGTLASGFLWSEDAERMVCFVWNVGDAPVDITSAQIVNSNGSAIVTISNCTVQPLKPGERCGMTGYGVTQAAGRVKVEGPRGRLRGTCQLLADGLVSVASTEMR